MRNSSSVESTAASSQAASMSTAAASASPASSAPSSVPLSLYRELSHELRETQTELVAIEQQNQQLQAQNQQLRQELHNLVQQVIQTQTAVTQMPAVLVGELAAAQPLQTTQKAQSLQPGAHALQLMPPRAPQRRSLRSVQEIEGDFNIAPPQLAQPTATTPAMTARPVPPTWRSPEWITPTSAPLTTRITDQVSQFTQDLQGWKLALVMAAIVLSAFGAGFLIVRPFMNQQSSQQQSSQQQSLPTQPQRLQR